MKPDDDKPESENLSSATSCRCCSRRRRRFKALAKCCFGANNMKWPRETFCLVRSSSLDYCRPFTAIKKAKVAEVAKRRKLLAACMGVGVNNVIIRTTMMLIIAATIVGDDKWNAHIE